MRKTLLLFTTTALALLLAAGMAWAALPAPTVVINTDPAPSGTPPTVFTTANITATFSEPMSTKSLGISNHSTFTSSSTTFYLLKGEFTARSATKNPMRFCFPGVTPPATPPTTTTPACDAANLVPATVSYNAGTNTATLNPGSTPTSTTVLQAGTKYTVVVEGTGDGDNVAVKDAAGTPLLTAGTGDSIFHFTTTAGGPGGF